MFQLIKFEKTGADIDVLVQYDLSTGAMHRQPNKFLDENIARLWILNMLKKYVLEKLKRYIDHKQVLSDVSPMWCTEASKEAKEHALHICLREYESIRQCDVAHICTVIILMEEYLTHILPLDKQKDYASSSKNLHDLLITCKEFIHRQKQND